MADEGAVESVVHEFEVLYSKRIHQKDKKWCDGVLKYYEFNSKIEICNEDQFVISTDFAQSKNHLYILGTKLRVGNQFKLSTNALVVEVTDKVARYTRDVTFKKKTPIKLEKIKYEQDSQSPSGPIIAIPSIDASSPKRENVLENKENYLVPVNEEENNDTVRVKIEGDHVFRNPILNPLTPLRCNKLLTSLLTQEGSKSRRPVGLTRKSAQVIKPQPQTITPFKKFKKAGKPLPRIPPCSSSHFKFLHFDPKMPSSPPSPVIKHEFKVESFQLKQNLEDANIIYDFSDFEEDLRFSQMLKQIHENKDAQCSEEDMGQVITTQKGNGLPNERPQTPPRLFQGLVTPLTNKKNESYEFDLSTQSDFDDIDIN